MTKPLSQNKRYQRLVAEGMGWAWTVRLKRLGPVGKRNLERILDRLKRIGVPEKAPVKDNS